MVLRYKYLHNRTQHILVIQSGFRYHIWEDNTFPDCYGLVGVVMVACRLLCLSGVETISPFCGALDYESVP